MNPSDPGTSSRTVSDPAPISPPGLVERFGGWLAGRLIVTTGRRAAAREDWHAVDHAFAALRYGSDVHRVDPCPLAAQDRQFGPNATEEGRAANTEFRARVARARRDTGPARKRR